MLYRMHGLVVGMIVVLGAASAAPAAWADALCVEDTQIDPDLGRALDRLVATAEVTVRAPGKCKADGARLIGRFSGREPVLFTLHTARGETFSRAVPWLTRHDAALVRLRAQGRLSAFSVLVEALLAEQRIAAGQGARAPQPAGTPAPATPAPAPATPAPAPATPAPAPATPAPQPPPVKPGSARPPAAEPPATRPPPAEPPAAGEPIPAKPAAAESSPAEPGPANAPVAPATAAGPRAAARGEAPLSGAPIQEDVRPPVPAAPSAASGTAPSLPARTAPAPEPQPPAPPERVTTVAPPVPAAVPLSGQVPAEGSPAAPPADARDQALSRPPAWPSPEVQVAGRMRSPDTLGIEIGAGVGWRSLFARAAYQPSTHWDFDGRLMETSGVAFTAGYRPALYRRGAWRVGPSLAATIERIAVQRADLRGAGEHPYWDPGISIGGAVTRDLEGMVRVTLQIEGFRSLGRTLRVPEGPEVDYNRYGARAALSFAWLP